MNMLRLVCIGVGAGVMLSADVQAQQGKTVFEGKGNCSTCHGKDGRGTPLAPNLTDGEWLNIDGSLDAIRALVRSGVAKPKQYPAPMPAMGGAQLSAAEIDAVAAYVFSLSRAAAKPGGMRRR